MNIHVNRIPADGLKEHATYDPAKLEMGRADIHVDESFDVDAVITKAGRELMVRVAIRCPVRFTCARCLEDFPTTLTPAGMLNYTVAPTDVVDITDDVRQEVMLAYPMVPVCKPDCKGLCPSCGQNWNTGTCSHATS